MVNIKALSYRLRFLENIVFKEDPQIAFFKAIFKRLKNILCINRQDRCSLCSYRESCLYNYMSAGDFANIEGMPIIIEKPLFAKRTFKKDDILDLKFLFLGDAAAHRDFFNHTLKEFEVRGLFKEGYRFLIMNVAEADISLERRNSIISGINILTPIDRVADVFKIEKEKMDRLNELYNITEGPLPVINKPYNFIAIEFDIKNALHIGSNRVMRRGYVGNICFEEPICTNNLIELMYIIGAGRFYGIGGGKIKICKV